MPTPAPCAYGVFSRRVTAQGYPKIPVTPVTAVTLRAGLTLCTKKNERKEREMPYAILRFQKRKAGGVAACERHNERKKEAYKSNPDIDMERSKNNYHLVPPPRYTYKKEINRMIAEAGCKVRRDSVMMVETLITASPEFMNSLPPEEQKAYFTMASTGKSSTPCRTLTPLTQGKSGTRLWSFWRRGFPMWRSSQRKSGNSRASARI